MTPRVQKRSVQERPLGVRTRCEEGFGLVELLVVVLMMGLVMGAVHSLYITTQRSATTEAEVVDVQQSLRVGVDQISRDLEMAGFMVPDTLGNPIAAATEGGASPDSITINTAAESLVAATITSPVPVVGAIAAGNVLDLPVTPVGGSLGGFEGFDVGSAVVRILNSRGWVAGATFTLIGINAPAGPPPCGGPLPAPPCILQLRANGAGTGPISVGDMIVKTGTTAGEAYPNTVQYAVAPCAVPVPGQCLTRATVPAPPAPALNPAVVATNVTDLQFRYLLDDGTEVSAPVADFSLVRAVRVTLNGQIVATTAVANGQTKARSLMSAVAIWNRSQSRRTR